MIAKQFLITGMIWAIIGGLMSVLFRLQLGYPDAHFKFLEDILGSKWAKGGQIQPEFYYALVTMHGTILVFFVLTGGLSGTFANFLIPLQIGARDMASPMLNMLSYWFFLGASVVMMSSLFIETGPASGGWTSYAPLSALGDANEGSKTGMDLWLVSMAMFRGPLPWSTPEANEVRRPPVAVRNARTAWSERNISNTFHIRELLSYILTSFCRVE